MSGFGPGGRAAVVSPPLSQLALLRKVGEVINDHDAALAYVLEYSPSVLPSFAALSREQQESIKFTQSKMEYNMGWLVQAEAPPGASSQKQSDEECVE